MNYENHKLIIRNVTSKCKDEYEIGEVEFINAYNGNSYTFSLWTDDDFDKDTADSFACNIYLNSPVSLSTFDNMTKNDLNSIFGDALFEMPLDDLLKDSREVRLKIKEHYENDEPFEIDIPFEAQGFSIKSILIDEHIVEMTYKAFEGTLSKQDILVFVKLMENDLDISAGVQKQLIEPIREIIKDEGISHSEAPVFNAALKALMIWESILMPKIDTN